MPLRRPTAATTAFGAVAALSLVVLFAPSGGGEPRFPHDDKVVHLLLFAALAATGRWRYGPAPAVLLAVAAYAPGSRAARSGDAADVVADLAGVALGWHLAGRCQQGREAEPPVGADEPVRR